MVNGDFTSVNFSQAILLEANMAKSSFDLARLDLIGPANLKPSRWIARKRKARAASVQSPLMHWPVNETNGAIMVWHDIDKRPPSFEIPDEPEFCGSDEWSEPLRRHWKLRTHNQEMAENVVDTAHFKYLHGTVNQPEAEIEVDGEIIHMLSPTTMTTPAGQVKGKVEKVEAFRLLV